MRYNRLFEFKIFLHVVVLDSFFEPAQKAFLGLRNLQPHSSPVS